MFVSLRHAILCCAAFLLLNGPAIFVRAADAETRAFEKADAFRRDKFYENAEKEFAAFIAKYPASPRISQALLLQAQSALAQKKFPAALNLLSTNMASAAGIADQFQFWIARTHLESGKLAEAADAFALLVLKHTNSSLRLEATIEEAKTRFSLQQWPRVIDLLQNPGGLLQQGARSALNADLVTEGRLLLAEALFQQRDFAGAERTAAAIPDGAMPAKSKWRRDYLRAKAQFSVQQLEDALTTTSNLIAIAAPTRDAALEAAATALQGQILEALNRPDAAILVYERNQRAGMPAERVREALFKIIELTVAQGQLTNGLARLQAFLTEHPAETGSDVALLTMAELQLKQHQLQATRTNGAVTNIALAGTNLLAEAITNCARVLRDFTNTAFAGEAQFVRGWALLAQGNNVASLEAFRSAAEVLPWSESQAVARFKIADLEFQSGELTNALRDYRRILGEYKSLRRVQSELVPRARYQMLQASLDARDLAAAHEAIEPILREYPMNGFAERTLLLYGQTVDELESPAAARNVFSKFIEHYPDSSLRPEVELAIARTYERERDWPGAIAKYDEWVKTFPTNDRLADAEFLRAGANYQAGRDSNAVTLFTNFIARFPKNPLGARAQYCVGNFYFGIDQFAEAERNYQLVLNTNWPVTALSYQARLKAGHAALLRPSFENATQYFTKLIEEDGCPDFVRVQAYFAYGDAFFQFGSTNALERFSRARQIFEQIPLKYPNDPLTPPAWGRMGDCYFQAGASDPANYSEAFKNYGKVTNSPMAELSMRLGAMVGIGNVQREQARLAEKRGATAEADALIKAARDNYLSVVYDSYDGEQPDPFWIKEAAIEAAKIEESLNRWEQARNLYLKIIDKVPALKSTLDKKVAKASEQAELQK